MNAQVFIWGRRAWVRPNHWSQDPWSSGPSGLVFAVGALEGYTRWPSTSVWPDPTPHSSLGSIASAEDKTFRPEDWEWIPWTAWTPPAPDAGMEPTDA